MKYSFLLIIAFLLQNIGLSQRTVGTTRYLPGALDGYTFFSPFSSQRAFIVDNCGQLINEWDRGTRPGLSAYFLENGLMLRTYKVNPIGPFTSASNAGGLELVDWDNNTVWSYEFNTSEMLSHHDAVVMPNGNILLLTWELIYENELIELGRDPNEIAPQGFAWNEKIIEFTPVGTGDIIKIWEWKIKDHYIQDFDPEKSNFGSVAEHPELFDINLAELNSPNSHSELDYNHFNAIDYNEELDQILISVRNSDEIWIIDHSTTIEEASSHSGGRYGKGGDILYRWGNAFSYDRATLQDEILFGQHGVHWVKDGIHKGKILIYNNGNGRPGNNSNYSTIELLTPDQNADGSYPVPDTEAYGPAFAEWTYGDNPGEEFYSPYLSNAQFLPNGNMLINAGSIGRIFEITPERENVWEYVIPLFGDFPATQGSQINNNGTFRAYKFDKDFIGFEGLDLTPGNTIEIDPNPLNCTTSTTEQNTKDARLKLNYNPATFELSNSGDQKIACRIFNLQGQLIETLSFEHKRERANIGHLHAGVYILNLNDEKRNFNFQKIIINH